MRLRYRNTRTPRRVGVGVGRKQKWNSSKIKKGPFKITVKAILCIRVLNRKLLSQNNVEYDMCSISLVGAWGGGGVGVASKTLIYSIS